MKDLCRESTLVQPVHSDAAEDWLSWLLVIRTRVPHKDCSRLSCSTGGWCFRELTVLIKSEWGPVRFLSASRLGLSLHDWLLDFYARFLRPPTERVCRLFGQLVSAWPQHVCVSWFEIFLEAERLRADSGFSGHARTYPGWRQGDASTAVTDRQSCLPSPSAFTFEHKV